MGSLFLSLPHSPVLRHRVCVWGGRLPVVVEMAEQVMGWQVSSRSVWWWRGARP